MDNLEYLLAVFGIVWVVMFIYLFSLINHQKKLYKEMQSLKKMLEDNNL